MRQNRAGEFARHGYDRKPANRLCPYWQRWRKVWRMIKQDREVAVGEL